jgi:phosphoglycerate dehydrogenase-like enzyme
MLQRAPRLKWLHVSNIGIDTYPPEQIFHDNVITTNPGGAVAIPMAEHAFAFILMLAKNANRLFSDKQNKRYQNFHTIELWQRTLGIIGLGNVGAEITKRALSMGMRVIGFDPYASADRARSLQVELFPPQQLHQMLSQSDFVVVACPLTSQTRGLIGEQELKAMKPSAFFINIARGEIASGPAIIKALKEGWIAGAGLDVFEPEPPPADSELWELPNLILSPHMSGLSDRHSARFVEAFCENLKRYVAGQQLLSTLKMEKGF